MLIKFDVLVQFYFLKPLELVSEANLSFTLYTILGFVFLKGEEWHILSQFSLSWSPTDEDARKKKAFVDAEKSRKFWGS